MKMAKVQQHVLPQLLLLLPVLAFLLMVATTTTATMATSSTILCFAFQQQSAFSSRRRRWQHRSSTTSSMTSSVTDTSDGVLTVVKEEAPSPTTSSPPLPPLQSSSGSSSSWGGTKPKRRQQKQHQQQSWKRGTSSKTTAASTTTSKKRRHDNDGAATTTTALPDNIPKLSDVLNGGNNNRNKRTNNTMKQKKRRGDLDSSSSSSSSTTKKKADNNNNKVVNRREPWKAGYYTSVKTQRRIKNAATAVHRGSASSSQLLSPVERAGLVLKTFLNTPPERCNPANLVCALTLSAKLVSGGGGGMSNNNDDAELEEFRSLFFQTTNALHEMLDAEGNLLSGRQLCNAAWAIAKHYDRDDRILPRNQANVAPSTAGTERDLSSSSKSNFAFVGHAETWDLSLILEESPPHRLDRLVDRIALQLTSMLDEDNQAAKEGELCMASWAYGVLRPRQRPPGWKSGPRLAATRRNSKKRWPQATADVVKFEKCSPLLLDPKDENQPRDPTTDSPSAADELFDAIARVLVTPRSSNPATTDAVVHNSKVAKDDVVTGVMRCEWSELANLAWAFASHGRSGSLESQDLLKAIGGEAAKRLRKGDGNASVLSRDIAQVVWSLGILQSDTFQLADAFLEVVDAAVAFNRVETEKRDPFADWSCADLVQIALSLAHARLDETGLLSSIYEEANRRLKSNHSKYRATGGDRVRKSFHAWEVSVLLWAQARLYLKEPQGSVFRHFAKNAAAHITKLARSGSALSDIGIGSQEKANLAWSLTVLEEYDNTAVDLLSRIFKESADSCQREGLIHLEHAHQLWQALFLLEQDCPGAISSVPEWFYSYLREKWMNEKARAKISSARHRSLSQVLDLMGVAHTNEHDEDIDVAIVLKSQASWSHETTKGIAKEGVKLAVEFDGPNHFTRIRETSEGKKASPPPRTLGHSVLKYRILKKQGWAVVRVPYYEFDKIPFWASMERQRYLQRLLKTHGYIRFSEIDVSEYKAPVHNRRSRFD